MVKASWRCLLVVGWAVWWGGLTFYGAVAVPAGTDVVGRTTEGFITRKVTVWLNRIAGAEFALLLANVYGERRAGRPFRALTYSGVLLVVLQVGLFALYPRLDRLLDPAGLDVVDLAKFKLLHRAYLWITAAQWGLGLVHMWFLVWNWQRPERRESANRSAV